MVHEVVVAFSRNAYAQVFERLEPWKAEHALVEQTWGSSPPHDQVIAVIVFRHFPLKLAENRPAAFGANPLGVMVQQLRVGRHRVAVAKRIGHVVVQGHGFAVCLVRFAPIGDGV